MQLSSRLGLTLFFSTLAFALEAVGQTPSLTPEQIAALEAGGFETNLQAIRALGAGGQPMGRWNVKHLVNWAFLPQKGRDYAVNSAPSLTGVRWHE